jgi:hypothetical protein
MQDPDKEMNDMIFVYVLYVVSLIMNDTAVRTKCIIIIE